MFMVEARNLDEATAAVSKWVVTKGTTLQSITGQAMAEGLPVAIEGGGVIGVIEIPGSKPVEAVTPELEPEVLAEVTPEPESEPEEVPAPAPKGKKK
jgi:hypothetical protein